MPMRLGTIFKQPNFLAQYLHFLDNDDLLYKYLTISFNMRILQLKDKECAGERSIVTGEMRSSLGVSRESKIFRFIFT